MLNVADSGSWSSVYLDSASHTLSWIDGVLWIYIHVINIAFPLNLLNLIMEFPFIVLRLGNSLPFNESHFPGLASVIYKHLFGEKIPFY